MDTKTFLEAAARFIAVQKPPAPILVVTATESTAAFLFRARERHLLACLKARGDDGSREIGLIAATEIRNVRHWEYQTFIVMETPPEQVEFQQIRGWGGRDKLLVMRDAAAYLTDELYIWRERVKILDGGLRGRVYARIGK